MFCDQVEIQVIGGKGGDGLVNFHREKYISHGGPDGGNGGKGGSVILQADENLNTLADFRHQKLYRAKDGQAGGKNNCFGKDGEDKLLKVPVGTVVHEVGADKVLADLDEIGSEVVLAKGGQGGKGNANFASSTRQTPDFAEKGEAGDERNLRLELKLVADVGIIGLPSVGKSTLIARISAARPKIADYPFTTLVPNLGVVNLTDFGGEKGKSMVVCDIPGLIEGAHQGKGLGDEFLRHVTRNRILVHLLDAGSSDILENYQVIQNELKKYDSDLAKKKQIVALNKVDLIDKDLQQLMISELKKKYPKIKDVMIISAVTGEGIKELIFKVWQELGKVKKLARFSKKKSSGKTTEEGFKIFRPHLVQDDRKFQVKLKGTKKLQNGKIKKIFLVEGKRLEQIVNMTDFENDGAVQRVYDVLEKMGVRKEIRLLGGERGDFVKIGEHKLKIW